MSKREQLIAGAVFVIGLIAGITVDRVIHRHDVAIYESNIGGFILKDGKVFTVHEMWREQIEGKK